LPELPPAADKLTELLNSPFFLEGSVTAVSSSEMSVRGAGSNTVQYYVRNEIETRKQRMRNFGKLSFYQMLGAYTQGAGR
jgi:hypothetical protein